MHGAARQPPRDPRVDGAEAQVAVACAGRVGRAATPTLVADWFGASARPCSALAVMQSSTVRRSCQPSAGPIGSPVVRSHTSVEARWVLMPTAADRAPARRAPRRRHRARARPCSTASNSTSPGTASTAGTAGTCDRAERARRRRSTAARTPRGADVDDEDAHRRTSCSLGQETLGCADVLPRHPPIEPAPSTAVQVEQRREPVDLAAADRGGSTMNTACATTYVPTAVTMPCASGSATRCTHAATPAPSTNPTSAPRLSTTASRGVVARRPPSGRRSRTARRTPAHAARRRGGRCTSQRRDRRLTATRPGRRTATGSPSLPGLRMPVGIECLLHRGEHAERRRRAPRPRSGRG